MFPELLLTLINDENINDIANIFYNQLIVDYDIYIKDDKREEITDLNKLNKPVEKIDNTSYYSYFTPYIKSKKKYMHELACLISFKLYPVDDMTDKVKRVHSYIRYNQYIRDIRNYKKNILVNNEKDSKTFFKRKEHIYNGATYYSLNNIDELSDNVLYPVPMPVNTAKLEELEPFFDYLKNPYDIKEDFQEFKRGIIYKDGRMDLCKQVVADVHIENLMNSLEGNDMVTHFLLGNNVISDKGSESIANFLNKKNDKIKTWYLAGNRIDSNGIKLITESLINNTHVDSLWLKRNPIMTEGAFHIANLLKSNTSIKVLDLHNTGILDEGAKYIFDSLKTNTTLKHLYLGACGLKNIDYIIDYFTHLIKHDIHGIEYIYLDMNRLGNKWADKLVSVIKDYKHIKGLVMSSNRITECSYILDTLSNNKSILYLDIGFYKSTLDMGELPNNLSTENLSKNVDSIVNFIRTNDTVKVFSILNTGLNEDNIGRIIESYDKNNNIIQFYYEQFNYDLGKYKKIAKDISSRNNTLNEDAKFIKHGKLINFIDSNYRNKM
jgi:hypothetical protein